MAPSRSSSKASAPLSPRRSLVAGLLCLALSAFLAPGRAPDDSGTAASGRNSMPQIEPLAQALMPLGPVRAVASSVLWMLVQAKQRDGDSEAVADLAEGLLALHPDLESVRVFLARQLVVSLAPRSSDEARHRALVARGLGMLEDGLELSDSRHLHGALGSLLAIQVDTDPRFAKVAALYFGQRPDDVAISELRLARPGAGDALNLILLLVGRGLTTLRLDGDRYEAKRDLDEAATVLTQFTEEQQVVIAAELEQLRRELEVPPSSSTGEAAGSEDRRS